MARLLAFEFKRFKHEVNVQLTEDNYAMMVNRFSMKGYKLLIVPENVFQEIEMREQADHRSVTYAEVVSMLKPYMETED